MNTFNWLDIEFKNKNAGSFKTTCPNCSHERKKKKDPCLYVNLDSGVAKCFNCDNYAFKDDLKKDIVVNYTLPSQEWRNYTKLSEKLVKWFEDVRCIKQFTLNKFEISEEVYFQPNVGKSVNNIVFNYFENDLLVYKKYRDAKKNFSASGGAKPIFYNINSVIGFEEVYILEGEIDVLSLDQIGITNCISLPTGANNNDNYWINCEKYLKDVKKFYIGVDNDEKGDEVAEKIAQRLGRYRCERIKWKGKDANEDLVNGVLEESVKNTIEYPVSGTIKHSELTNGMLNLKKNGIPETIKPKQKRFEELNRNFSVMRGHLVTVTGIPSHGKSAFIEDYSLALVNDLDFKLSVFSPEHHPIDLHAMNLCSKVIGRLSFKESDEGIIKYSEWANERVYFTSAEGSQVPTWDWIFETFTAQMMRFGIDMFIIDAFNKVVIEDQNELKAIRTILTKLTAFAQQNNVIVFLVAHPTKMRKVQGEEYYEIPDLYDVAGSADFRNQTHDGICVYRDFANNTTSVINLKTKNSFQGNIGGSAIFNYDKDSGRFNKENDVFDKVSYIDSTFTLKGNEYEIPKLDPYKAFGEQNLIIEDEDFIPF